MPNSKNTRMAKCGEGKLAIKKDYSTRQMQGIMRAFDARSETWLLRLTASEIAALQDGRILPPWFLPLGERNFAA